MAKIIGVDKDGIGYQLGIKKGDNLIAFNNKPLEDILDYYYYDGMEEFVMTVESDDEIIDFEIEKESYEQLGLELDESLDITPIRCKNKCKFCFVDQLPKGMRETLYVKDDDYRLSFISGNFITLTNVGERELKRIVDMRLSPLYISVHATNPDVKHKLVSNPEARNTYRKLKFLTDNGICIHTQVVLCPNENDGEILERTVSDIIKLKPMVKTMAIVPVGLTGHRENLYKLNEVSKEKADEVINLIEKINDEQGGNFIWCSDEFYIKADRKLPDYSDYGDFDQIENGVGLVRMFEKELTDALSITEKSAAVIKLSVITGVSFGGELNKFIPMIKIKFPNLDIGICVVENDFFGRTITVAGLITATDIIKQYKGKLNKNVTIPANMLREFTDTFLDGMTVSELEAELNVKIHVCNGGEQLIDIIESLKEKQ